MNNEKEQMETVESHVTDASTIEPVNDGHYHYPGPVEEGYSGNTGRAVQPAGKKNPDIPLNKDTFNYTRLLK